MIDPAAIAGRYGAYIWPAYGVSLLGFVGMLVDTTLRARRWRREADRRAEQGLPTESDEP